MAPRILRLQQPLSRGPKLFATALAFLLPLLAWCAISYVPFFWHPLVLVQDAGDTTVSGKYDYLAADQRVDLETFEARNVELAQAKAKLATGERVNPIYLPAPHEVARAFYTAFTTAPERRGDYWLHESILHSCQIIFWGFIYAAVLGLPLGILCGAFPAISQLVEPFVDFVRYMPAPVFGALAVAIFGLADAPKVTVIFIGTFFQMLLVVANTTRMVDGSLLHAGQTLGASRLQLLTKIVLPSALPSLYRDMRILIGWAWTYLVVAELIGEKSGISAFIYQQQRYRNFDNVYASIVIIGAIGLLFDQLLGIVGKYLFPWETSAPRLGQVFKKWLNRDAKKPGKVSASVLEVGK